MGSIPETDVSLILRLPEAVDPKDWIDFSERYQPLIYRFGTRRGLSEQDAQDLVQRVMMSVARSVGRWRPSPDMPRFRNWLFTIARNQLINLVNARRPDQATGGSAHLEKLRATVDAATGTLDDDYRHEVFLWAAARVRSQVHAQSWTAFWKTSVEGIGCDLVASQLNMTVGAVYATRSRIMSRLKDEVLEFGELE